MIIYSQVLQVCCLNKQSKCDKQFTIDQFIEPIMKKIDSVL